MVNTSIHCIKRWKLPLHLNLATILNCKYNDYTIIHSETTQLFNSRVSFDTTWANNFFVRLVYRWYASIYSLCYGIGLTGYILLFLALFRIPELVLKISIYTDAHIFSFGVTALFYGLYFGTLVYFSFTHSFKHHSFIHSNIIHSFKHHSFIQTSFIHST